MILLLEGLNCTGKSTLAAQFSKDLDWPILKFNVPHGSVFQYFHEALQAAAEDQLPFIADRCHLSNRAYNGRLGGGVMTFSEWSALDEWLRGQGTWLFLMLDDPFAIATRLQQREGRDDGANQLSRHESACVQNEFVNAFQRSRIEVKGQFTLPQFIDPITGLTTDHYHSVLEQIQREANGGD